MDKKSDEGCEIEEVEEEADEEEVEEDTSTDNRDTRRKTCTTIMSMLPPSERKIILEFGKPCQKAETELKQHYVDAVSGPHHALCSSSIMSLESCSTMKSRSLSAASRKVEKKIFADQDIEELIDRQTRQEGDPPITPSEESPISNTNKIISMDSISSGDGEISCEQNIHDVPMVVGAGNTPLPETARGKASHNQMDSAVSALKAALAAESNIAVQNQKLTQKANDDQWKPNPKPDFDVKPVLFASVGSNAGATPKEDHPNLDRSLTDRTLKVVTEKVRMMNSK